jgi:hypothetical protein
MRRSAALLGILVVGVAACGGSSKPSAAQQQAAVTTTWTTFFSPNTPPAQAVTLLQNGTALQPVITKLRTVMPAGLSVKVDSVAVTGTTAMVTYDLLNNGQSLLGHSSTGNAIEVNGKWLVSHSTFCGLSTLAGDPCPS